MENANKKNLFKKLALVVFLLIVIGAFGVYYIFNEKFEDTGKQTAAFTVGSDELIKEFQANDSAANKKYLEKIMVVKGKIEETEAADSTINIKMMDTLTGSYIIFAFQQQHLNEAKHLKEGDVVSIKGSCSGGTYSKILETEFISFKRCAISN